MNIHRAIDIVEGIEDVEDESDLVEAAQAIYDFGLHRSAGRFGRFVSEYLRAGLLTTH